MPIILPGQIDFRRKYETIGNWRVSLQIPEPVRTGFRIQTERLLSGDYASVDQVLGCDPEAIAAWPRASLVEHLLKGGTAFVSPNPKRDQSVYFIKSGLRRWFIEEWSGSREFQSARCVLDRLKELDKLYVQGGEDDPQRQYLLSLATIDGEYLAADVPSLVTSPDLRTNKPCPARLEIAWRVLEGPHYILPASNPK